MAKTEKVLSKEQKEKLKALKIKATDHDGARKELIEALAKKEVDGVDSDPLDELIIMYESFFEDDGGEEEAEEETEEEVEEKPKKTAKGDQFTKMNRDELKSFISENELDVKVMKSDSDEALRVKIREAVNNASEAEETEEEEEEAKPAKPAKKGYKEEEEYDELAEEAAAEEETEEEEEAGDEFDAMDREALKKHIVAKKLDVKVFKSDSDDQIRDKIRAVVAPKATKTTKAASKPAAKAKVAKKEDKEKKRAYDVEKDLPALKPLIKLFPGQEVKKLKAGITIQHPGKSSKRVLISFDHIKVAPDGEMTGDVFFNIFKGADEVKEKIGEEFTIKNYNFNLCFVPKLTLQETMDMLGKDGLIEEMIRKATLSDGRAVKNKEKLEEKMSTSDKKVTKKAVAVEEEEEEEEVKPVKKAAAPAKTATKPVTKKAAVEEEEEEEEEPVVKKPAKKK